MSTDAGLAEALRSKLAVAFIVRDEGRYAVQMLESVRRIAGFVSCLDTGSSDDTPAQIARFLDGAGVPYRIDAGQFSRYDEMRNTAVAGVPEAFPWVLMLDADEIILERDFAQLLELIEQDGVDAWDLPRFNWTDRLGGERTAAYPDLQSRLFRNPAGGAGPRYVGEIHETLTGYANKQPSDPRIAADGQPCGLHIHHLKLFQKSHAELQAREDSYREVYLRDVLALRRDHLQRIWHGVEPFAQAARYAGREDFQGWASDHEWLKAAIRDLRPRLAVDVGVWKGGSTLTMAATLREQGIAGLVIAVDTWLGAWDHWLQPEWFPSLRVEDGYPTLYRTFMANVAARELQDYVIPLPLDSINAANVLRQRQIFPDIVHIDAGHDYDAVTSDLRLWWPLVAEGGMLIGDDYHPAGDTWPDVRRAFQDFFGTTEIENSGGKCRIRKQAAMPPPRAGHENKKILEAAMKFDPGFETSVIVMFDVKLVVPPESFLAEYARNGLVYEEHVSRNLLPMLKPGMCFVDVGANVGAYSLAAALRVGPGGKVIAIDPDQRNAQCIFMGAALNGFQNVQVWPVAASDRMKTEAFLQDAHTNSGTRDLESVIENRYDLVVGVPLDLILSGESRVDIIKIDVGAREFPAMSGARDILARHRPIVFSEFTPHAMSAVSNVDPEVYLDLFLGLGYDISVISYPDGKVLEFGKNKSALFDLVMLPKYAEIKYLDLIFVP